MTQTVATAVVPKPLPEIGLLKEEDEPQSSHIPKQRQGKLFEELDLGGLGSWPLELGYAAHQLLAKYHDVFSLELAELGCTHSTKHTTRVTDNAPFKEQFR